MVSQSMRQLGAQGNPMRVLFEYGKKRAAIVGEENVLDFALGNPSVPPPARVNEVIMEILSGDRRDSIHAYTSAPGDLEVRNTIAGSLNRRFDAGCQGTDLFLSCGAAGEEQIRPLASGIKPAVQGAGDGVAHLQIPWGAGVGVDGIPAIPGQYLHNHLVHPGGRGDGGVAQGKIQHIFLAHNGGALLSVFKQHPHGVALGPQLAHGL